MGRMLVSVSGKSSVGTWKHRASDPGQCILRDYEAKSGGRSGR